MKLEIGTVLYSDFYGEIIVENIAAGGKILLSNGRLLNEVEQEELLNNGEIIILPKNKRGYNLYLRESEGYKRLCKLEEDKAELEKRLIDVLVEFDLPSREKLKVLQGLHYFVEL